MSMVFSRLRKKTRARKATYLEIRTRLGNCSLPRYLFKWLTGWKGVWLALGGYRPPAAGHPPGCWQVVSRAHLALGRDKVCCSGSVEPARHIRSTVCVVGVSLSTL